MKLDKFLCFMFLSLTLHKTHLFFEKITNQILRLNYAQLIYEPVRTENKRLCRVTVNLTSIATTLFSKSICRRDLRESSMNAFGRWITRTDVSCFTDLTLAKHKFEAFYTIMSNAVDLYLPKKTVRMCPNNKPWVTPKLTSLIRQRQNALSTLGKDSARFKDLRNRDLTSNFIPLPESAVELVPIPQELLVCRGTVFSALRSIKVKTSYGPVPVPAVVWKEFAFELADVIKDLYNSSLDQGVVPVQIKESIVHPLPKCNPPKSIEEDLRPITLTSH